jgi:hypothetical protein
MKFKEKCMIPRLPIKLLLACVVFLLSCFTAFSQVYTGSGSTGSDGPLTFPNAHPGDVIVFNPATYGQKPLDPSNDGIFNFTNITIPTGVTVKLTSTYINHPVYWLATGNVDIEGTLDLSGGDGAPPTSLPSIRVSSVPGPGGYPGGVWAVGELAIPS